MRRHYQEVLNPYLKNLEQDFNVEDFDQVIRKSVGLVEGGWLNQDYQLNAREFAFLLGNRFKYIFLYRFSEQGLKDSDMNLKWRFLIHSNFEMSDITLVAEYLKLSKQTVLMQLENMKTKMPELSKEFFREGSQEYFLLESIEKKNNNKIIKIWFKDISIFFPAVEVMNKYITNNISIEDFWGEIKVRIEEGSISSILVTRFLTLYRKAQSRNIENISREILEALKNINQVDAKLLMAVLSFLSDKPLQTLLIEHKFIERYSYIISKDARLKAFVMGFLSRSKDQNVINYVYRFYIDNREIDFTFVSKLASQINFGEFKLSQSDFNSLMGYSKYDAFEVKMTFILRLNDDFFTSLQNKEVYIEDIFTEWLVNPSESPNFYKTLLNLVEEYPSFANRVKLLNLSPELQKKSELVVNYFLIGKGSELNLDIQKIYHDIRNYESFIKTLFIELVAKFYKRYLHLCVDLLDTLVECDEYYFASFLVDAYCAEYGSKATLSVVMPKLERIFANSPLHSKRSKSVIYNILIKYNSREDGDLVELLMDKMIKQDLIIDKYTIAPQLNNQMKRNELFRGRQDLSSLDSSNWNELHVILDDVIHELNQPIGSLGNIVFAFQNLLQSSNTKLQDLKHALVNLTEVSNSIGLRLASYRALSSGGQENLDLDIRKIISESIESLIGIADQHRVSIEFSNSRNREENFLVFGNAFQLRIAFRGILLNSIQALAETNILNKKILITVIPVGREFISIYIRDNGPGVTPEIREKIFERGFTTKSGRGLGLGLPLVSAVISNHGGRVNLSDKTGVGAEFIIELPLSNSDEGVIQQ